MTRLERRNWTQDQIGIKSQGGLFDFFDNAIKEIYRITDDEYDHLCSVMTDEETQLLVTENMTYAQKKQILTLLKKHVYEAN